MKMHAECDAGREGSSPAAIILCGGRSSRMGVPKEALPFGNTTSLHLVIDAALSVCGPVIVVGRREMEWPSLPDTVIRTTDEVSFPGALSGFIQGLQALPDAVDQVFLLGCDFPLVSAGFLTVLSKQLRSEEDVAVPVYQGFPQPLLALYRRSVLPVALRLLAQENRRMQSLLTECRTRFIPAEEFQTADPELRSLQNMNSQADYERLLLLHKTNL